MMQSSNAINWPGCCPDGQVGGRGFVIEVEDLQKSLNAMRELVYRLKQSLFDECYNNPYWKPVKEQFEKIRSEAVDEVQDTAEEASEEGKKEGEEGEKDSGAPAPEIKDAMDLLRQIAKSDPDLAEEGIDVMEIQLSEGEEKQDQIDELAMDFQDKVDEIEYEFETPPLSVAASAILDTLNIAHLKGAHFLTSGELAWAIRDSGKRISPEQIRVASQELLRLGKIKQKRESARKGIQGRAVLGFCLADVQ